MALDNLIRRIPLSREEVDTRDAFLLVRRDEIYIVEQGHMDLFRVVVNDHGEVLIKAPFIARIPAGNAFFGSLSVPAGRDGDSGFMAYQAVPAHRTVLLRGEREHLASPDAFDLDAVTLIDDWVVAASAFLASHEVPPRETLLLEADPDIPYAADSRLSAHHNEILWVSADRPGLLVGDPRFPVAEGAFLPLSEHIWLTLPEEARVSAVHTPRAIVAGLLWDALDRYNVQVLRCAESYWVEARERISARHALGRRTNTQLRGAMLRELTCILSAAPADIETRREGQELLQAAAAVAASIGVRLVNWPDAADGDPLEAVDAVVTPSGIRTRRIRLAPGWERRDGPSFLGVVADEESRPVAVINDGRDKYKMIDPVRDEVVPVNRRRAESLDSHGVMFYLPLAEGVDNGRAAVLQALRGRGRDIKRLALMASLGALAALLPPIVTGELLAEIIPREDFPMWTAALVALVLGAFTASAVSIVGAFSMLRIEARIDETFQVSIWGKLLALPSSFFRRYSVGDLADRVNGISLIRQVLTGSTGNTVVSGTFSIFSYALLFYYSWELALWTGLALILLVATSWFFIRHQIRHQRAVFKLQGAVEGLVFQMILGLSKLRQAHAEVHALMRWSERYAEQKRAHLSARRWAAGQHTVNALFGPLSQFALLALVWYWVLESGTLTVEDGAQAGPGGILSGDGDEDATATPFGLADFLSFHTAFGQFMGALLGTTAAWTTAVSALPLFERVKPILEAQPESAPGSKVLPSLAGRIEFEHVRFRYPMAERETLADVSFQVSPGEYVAFVGPTGAGKSTLYRMLLGFERPSSGSVLLDGHDLLSVDLSGMRRQMGVVLQNGQLAPDSILNNVADGAPLTREEVLDAVRAAGLEEDIEALPMGINAMLAEGAPELSGGQKQRLLIARALARKPRVLLLDEPTSMLDNRSQDTILTTLRGLTATRIVIAHRLSTLVDVDRIYVMRDGRIVETGEYHELMERGGELAQLALRQLV